MNSNSKSKRPADDAFSQQRLPTWFSTFGKIDIAVVFLTIGIMFLPIGTTLLQKADNVYEQRIIYDGGSLSNCSISNQNEGKLCEVTFNLKEDVNGKLHLYYELNNFYQNHRRYFSSRSIPQLQGEVLSSGDVELDCNPLFMNGTQLLNPCGLTANSFFNDVISLNSAKTSGSLTLNETGISLRSDRKSLFSQVRGFQSGVVPNSSFSCESAVPSVSSPCNDYYDPSTNQYYKYHYPNDETVQYLHETYPKQISPLVGVNDEHFIVWMRVALLPTFRKLYGFIYSPSTNNQFYKNDNITFSIIANFEVDSFDAKKSLIITNVGEYGGKNPVPGVSFITVGSISLFIGCISLIFGIIEYRKLTTK
eukprot:gene5632-7778_t